MMEREEIVEPFHCYICEKQNHILLISTVEMSPIIVIFSRSGVSNGSHVKNVLARLKN